MCAAVVPSSLINQTKRSRAVTEFQSHQVSRHSRHSVTAVTPQICIGTDTLYCAVLTVCRAGRGGLGRRGEGGVAAAGCRLLLLLLLPASSARTSARLRTAAPAALLPRVESFADCRVCQRGRGHGTEFVALSGEHGEGGAGHAAQPGVRILQSQDWSVGGDWRSGGRVRGPRVRTDRAHTGR